MATDIDSAAFLSVIAAYSYKEGIERITQRHPTMLLDMR